MTDEFFWERETEATSPLIFTVREADR